jgi:hypothetical protein
MKKILFVALFTAVMAAAFALSCGTEEKKITDAGPYSADQTKEYLGVMKASDNCFKGKQALSSGAEVTVYYTVQISDDVNTYLNRPTIRRTWKDGTGIAMMEWFEVKGDKVYMLRNAWTEKTVNDHVTDFDPNVLYAHAPWKDTDEALVTMVGSDKYEYSALASPIEVPAGMFQDAIKVITIEAGRTGAYHFVPYKGYIQFQYSKHPKFGTLEVRLSPMSDCN